MKKILFSTMLSVFLFLPFIQVHASEDMMDSHDEMMDMVQLMEEGQLDAESQKVLAEHVNLLVDEKVEDEMMEEDTMMDEDMMSGSHFGFDSFMSTSPLFQIVHVLFILLILSLLTMLNILTYQKIKGTK